VWERRYRRINERERHLAENGFRIVELFLNISKEAQLERFLARIDEPGKNWRFCAGDVAERAHWGVYQAAFSDMLSATSTEWAPWCVIHGDRKRFARVAAAAVIVDALADIGPRYPVLDEAARAELLACRARVFAERPADNAAGKAGRRGEKRAS
jgi:polyphosphate kinase 2 (PPK2 family)